MSGLRVLFLCTGNSARSQLAEALLRKLSHGKAEVFSAGTHPQSQVHPVAKAVLEEKYDVDTSGLFPKGVERFAGQTFDYVITVCDRAAETCPSFPGDTERIHWGFDDPAAVPPGPEQRRAFEIVADSLVGRLRVWMALPRVAERLAA